MSEIIPYKIEKVKEGSGANWPNKTDYREPSKNGFVFDGWDFDWKNKVIIEPTEIHPKWDRLYINVELNHNLVSGDGDSEEEYTEIRYWVYSNNGKKISNEAMLEEIPLDDSELPLVYTNRIETVENNENIIRWKTSENDVNTSRYFRFFVYTNLYGVLQSEAFEVRQVGKNQTILPSFDYMTFTYTWTSKDGIDLDSATIVRNSNIAIESSDGKTLNDYFVGFGGITNGLTPIEREVESYLKHGGNNNDSGNEGALVNFKKICNRDLLSEDIRILYIDIYGNWYNTKGIGNMSVTFKTYKGNDGMKQDEYIFIPEGDTQQISEVTLENINVNACSPLNINKNEVEDIVRCYSKIATLEYDIRYKNAVLIGNYERSGYDWDVSIDIDNNTKSLNNGTANGSCDITKDAGTNYFKLSPIKEILNGVENNLTINKDEITCTFSPLDDNFITYVFNKSDDGSVRIIYNYTSNETNNNRSCIFTLKKTSEYNSYTITYNITQTS